jgi:hypothetical protein
MEPAPGAGCTKSITTIPEEVAMSRVTSIRLGFALVTAAALVLITAGATLAKCETDPDQCEGMIVTLDPGGPMSAGTNTVGILVLEDEMPIAASGVHLTFTRIGDGTTVEADAVASNEAGRWVATVDLPQAGSWGVVAEVAGTESTGTFTLDTVAVGTTVTPPGGSAPALAGLHPAVPLVTLVALVAGLAGLVAVNRRKQAAAAS